MRLRNSSAPVLQSQGYTYDLASRMTSSTLGGVTTSYGYDNADQLVSESRPGYSVAYTYDSNGNRLSKTLNGVAESYTYDAAGRTRAVVPGGQTRITGEAQCPPFRPRVRVDDDGRPPGKPSGSFYFHAKEASGMTLCLGGLRLLRPAAPGAMQDLDALRLANMRPFHWPPPFDCLLIQATDVQRN